jgi:uncharacterized protein
MIQVTVVFSPAPRTVLEIQLRLPVGTMLSQALAELPWPDRGDVLKDSISDRSVSVGIWGRKAGPETVLREGDRLELYRPLRVDPKVARRERFVGQGARSAGLFAKRRAHSKAGY